MEYIIHKNWRGWGVWEAEKDWREKEALDIFSKESQAEEFEQQLLEQDRHLEEFNNINQQILTNRIIGEEK